MINTNRPSVSVCIKGVGVNRPSVSVYIHKGSVYIQDEKTHRVHLEAHLVVDDGLEVEVGDLLFLVGQVLCGGFVCGFGTCTCEFCVFGFTQM